MFKIKSPKGASILAPPLMWTNKGTARFRNINIAHLSLPPLFYYFTGTYIILY